mgnify:CR=1 FL=1
MSKSYYNENDRFAAAWLRELIDEGLIPEGEVDERSITDIRGSDLVGFTQCHFFAGIGGWSYALQLAGWPEDRPVWTGSCPCQPLSSAGQRKGHEDERHLWPAFYELIAERRPPTIFGEQVASKDGREWLCGIRTDLEDARYAVGAADLCAAGAGAPHIRQRIWWVADAERAEQSGTKHQAGRSVGYSADGGVADANQSGRKRSTQRQPISSADGRHNIGGGSSNGGVADACKRRLEKRNESVRSISESDANGVDGGMGDTDDTRSQGRRERFDEHTNKLTLWSSSELIACADGKARRAEPSIFPLANGFPNRVGTLRGAGNAIVPQVSAEFIGAYLDGHP